MFGDSQLYRKDVDKMFQIILWTNKYAAFGGFGGYVATLATVVIRVTIVKLVCSYLASMFLKIEVLGRLFIVAQ